MRRDPGDRVARSTPGGPSAIQVRGARVNNLRAVDVEIPLRAMVAVAGVSGSGKSSLAQGVLYAEGSRRYLEALSTYTRRRMAQAPRAAVDAVEHVPAALTLRQRPGVPGVRSTFGTSTELLNVLRVVFSRLASHLCPNGHRCPPSIRVAQYLPITCPQCGVEFMPPGAEALAFNSDGACPVCAGTGVAREIDDELLVPDPSRSIDEGAVAAWSLPGLGLMTRVVGELGVRTDVPFAQLRDDEREIVLRGSSDKRQVTVTSKAGRVFDLEVTYRSARVAVDEALHKADSASGLARIDRFLRTRTCSACGGTRLSERARAPRIGEAGLADATAMPLDDVVEWVGTVEDGLPPEMREMARVLVSQFLDTARRLTQLGLGYLGLDRASSTLSTGERQRVSLSRAVRNQTTGVLYVLDEPSIGLHPANVDGLLAVLRELLVDGNSVVLVDHDVQVLREADWMVEIGPGSGADGGTVLATGTVADLEGDEDSLLGDFLADRAPVVTRERAAAASVFDAGRIHLVTSPVHTVGAVDLQVPLGRLVAVTGVSGSGKTTVVLDSLVPGLQAATASPGPQARPEHVVSLDPGGLRRVQTVDASPIGTNVRSTVATYGSVMDDLRRAFAETPEAIRRGLTAADFSHNTGSLRCPRCTGTGQITLDIQFLPDVDIACPDCGGSRYADAAGYITRETPRGSAVSLPGLLALTVREAAEHVADLPATAARLGTLAELGLGYLTLGEATPSLSGGEAQRLKLATEVHRRQGGTLFVLDEPSVGLHPLDVRTLLTVIERLLDRGATVIVVEHDLDLIANADYVVDMGPGGGAAGGRVVARGTAEQVVADPESVTGRYLATHLEGARTGAGR